MSQKDKYEEDDGRTVADMSEVGGVPLFGAIRELKASQKKQNTPQETTRSPYGDFFNEEDKTIISKEERRMWILAAMKAGLLIALAYGAGFAILIILMITIGGAW